MEFKIKCLNNTPLIEVVIKDNKEITKLLLSKPGVDINHRNILIPNDSLHSEKSIFHDILNKRIIYGIKTQSI